MNADEQNYAEGLEYAARAINGKVKNELRDISRRLYEARKAALVLEKERNNIIKTTDLTPSEIMEATELTKGRVSQIRGEAY
jgi:DNA-directed RNA polymerase specialized sigma subunit